MIEMMLARIVMQEHQDHVVIHLRERDGARGFPIVIGQAEAREIKRKVHSERTPRPFTHDLLRSVLKAVDAEIVDVAIDALRKGTFYAKLHIRCHGEDKQIDARSSDAIALAIAERVPIYVAEEVLDEATS